MPTEETAKTELCSGLHQEQLELLLAQAPCSHRLVSVSCSVTATALAAEQSIFLETEFAAQRSSSPSSGLQVETHP